MSESPLDRILQSLDVDIQAIAFCELRNGLRLLASPEELVIVHYVLAGTMYLAVDGQAPLICGQGGIVIVPATVAQTISATKEADQSFAAIDRARLGPDGIVLVDGADGEEGDLRFACGAISARLPGFSALLGAAGGPIVEDLSDMPFVHEAFGLMLHETIGRETGARALASALMKSCLVLFMRRRLARSEGSQDLAFTHPKIGRALSAIIGQPAFPHSVASLAVEAGMSRSAFAKTFQELVGVSPMTVVARTRLKQAAYLLRSTSMPIKAVAATVGMSSRSHFSRSFRQVYHVDPSEFRKSPPDGTD